MHLVVCTVDKWGQTVKKTSHAVFYTKKKHWPTVLTSVVSGCSSSTASSPPTSLVVFTENIKWHVCFYNNAFSQFYKLINLRVMYKVAHLRRPIAISLVLQVFGHKQIIGSKKQKCQPHWGIRRWSKGSHRSSGCILWGQCLYNFKSNTSDV